MHTHDPERAHYLLSRTPGVAKDPWLLSAEIVAARVMSRSSRLLKRGRELLESGRFAPKEVSELAGALGTEEYWTGSQKTARRHLTQALIDPTENAVAQASWLARHSGGFVVPAPAFDVPRAFEATTMRAMEADKHDVALVSAASWQRDEPFSGRPAVVGAWTASVARGDYGLALQFIDAARPSNPADPRLLANEFYALACSGRLDDADRAFQELERAATGSGWSQLEWQILLEADRGLLAFRRGGQQSGAAHYRRAIEMAVSHGFRELAAHAYVNFAMELSRVDPRSEMDEMELERAVQLVGPATRGGLALFVSRIRALRRLGVRAPT